MDFYRLDLSNFIFQEKIGDGSQSSCFLAIEKGTKQKCAALVSRFSSSENSLIISRILGQIKIRFKINCPTIPKFIGYNMNNSNRYINSIIITEFIPNGTLDCIITMDRKQCSDLNWTETKKLINIYGIAFGMSYLHSLNIIHRDLATKNILLDEFLYPKIIDFALALDLNDKGKITEKEKKFDAEKDVKIEINENIKEEIKELNDDKNNETNNNEKEEKIILNDKKDIKIDENEKSDAKELNKDNENTNTNFNNKINDKENDHNDDNKDTKIEITDKLAENSKDFNDEEQDSQKLFDGINVIHIDDNKDSLVGTPSYMAPEIWEEMRYSKSSDVFAFSIVLYEILTSEFPYKAETAQQLSSFIKEGGRPDIENKGIPKCFVDLLKKCWDPKPEKRPTFEEIVTQLKTNKEFITELSIDEEEFLNYQKLIEEKIDENHNSNYTDKVEKISSDFSTDIDENNYNDLETKIEVLSTDNDENNANKVVQKYKDLSTDVDENNANKVERIYSDVSTDIDENNYNDLETKIKDLVTDIGVISNEKLERKNKDLSIDVDEIDLSNCKLDEHIDQGSFSSVYKIIDVNTNVVYAAKISLKTIDDYSNLQMISLEREVTILSKLKFPSIIRFIGYNKKNFKNQSKPTIITEFAKNQSLEEMIIFNKNYLNNNIWNETKKLINVYGIASAMSYMHSLNFIHRDLKPANIFLDEFLYPKIGGFGLSKEEEESNKEDVDENENVGTFLYMAPEVLTKNKYYKESDVYSFALIVYYIVTIKQPYEGFKFIDIIEKVPEGIRPEFNSCTPNYYKELIEKCWSNDYNERPTFDDIIHILKTNKEFITENVDKDEFFNYIEYIESTSNDKNFNQVSFDIEHLKELKRIEEIEEIKSSIKEPFLDLNNYEKGSLIVKDENSTLFEVKNKETGVFYAAKILNTKLLANDVINISNEISVISKMNHSTLLKFVGFSPVDFNNKQKSIILSEIPPSNNLSKILDKERNNEKIDGWNDTQKLICLYGISLGMSYLHSNGIIHRNLSTKSVFLDENLLPKIGNFGLLTKFHDLTNQTIINLDENLVFSSPELLLSNKYSKSSDVYSFSLIVFELMTLNKPFKNIKNLKELINEVTTNSNRPELNDSIPESYLKLIKDCWSQDPSNRPTFDQIASMLKSDTGFKTEKVNKEVFENYVKSVDNEKNHSESEIQVDHEEECNKKTVVVSVVIEEEEEVGDEIEEKIEKVNHNEDETEIDKKEETEIDKKEEIVNHKEEKEDKSNIDNDEDKLKESNTANNEEDKIEKSDKENDEDGFEKSNVENIEDKNENISKEKEEENMNAEINKEENKHENNSIEKEEEVTDGIDTKNEEESNKDDMNKSDEVVKKRKNRRKKRKNTENIEKTEIIKPTEEQKDYLEIEDENNNYKEQLRKLNETSENDEKVLKISFKISAINIMNYEASDSDVENEEKNDNNNENEQNDQIQSKSKRPSKRRKKARKLRRKQKTEDQDEIEEDRNSKIEIETIENEEERFKKEKEERIRKEDEVRPKKRKIVNVGTDEEEEKFNNEEEWLKNKIEELFNGDDDDDEEELNFGNKEEVEEIRIDKIGERLRKENEERIKKEKEEKLKKEEERIKKENEEKIRKEKEDENRKEKDELFRKEVERLKKENEERIKKENEERLKKEEEKLKKEKEEKLRKEREERIKREKEEKARKENEEKLRKEEEEKAKREKEEKLRKEKEEKIKREKEEKARKENEERLLKEVEEKLKKEEANKLTKGKDDNKTAYAKILSKYKNVEDVVIMQLDSSQSESHSSHTKSDSIPKPNFQLGSQSNKSPRRPNESSSEINSKKFNTPPSQKVKSSPDHQKSLIHSNSIKLTVTLKDIGMGEFETHDHEIQEPKEKNEDQNSPRRNQTKLIQNSQPNDKELPRLNNLNKHSNQSQIGSNSQSQTENKLPKLLKNHSNISVQNDQNQFNPNKVIRSPRRNREKSSNYDPSVFYSPPSKTNTFQNKPVAIDPLIKSPIKLKVTLKDIGMEGFDSSTPNKTQKSQECGNISDQKDDERPRSRRYQRPA